MGGGSNPYYGESNPGSYDHLCNEMRRMNSNWDDFRTGYASDWKTHRDEVRGYCDTINTSIGTVSSDVTGLRTACEDRWRKDDEWNELVKKRWELEDADMKSQMEYRKNMQGWMDLYPGYPPPPPPFQ